MYGLGEGMVERGRYWYLRLGKRVDGGHAYINVGIRVGFS